MAAAVVDMLLDIVHQRDGVFGEFCRLQAKG